jgi:hypothetical protein
VGATKLSVQWMPEVFSERRKWLGHESDHSPQFSAEVKKCGVKPKPPAHVFVEYSLNKLAQEQLNSLTLCTRDCSSRKFPPLGTV